MRLKELEVFLAQALTNFFQFALHRVFQTLWILPPQTRRHHVHGNGTFANKSLPCCAPSKAESGFKYIFLLRYECMKFILRFGEDHSSYHLGG